MRGRVRFSASCDGIYEPSPANQGNLTVRYVKWVSESHSVCMYKNNTRVETFSIGQRQPAFVFRHRTRNGESGIDVYRKLGIPYIVPTIVFSRNLQKIIFEGRGRREKNKRMMEIMYSIADRSRPAQGNQNSIGRWTAKPISARRRMLLSPFYLA